jgi:6-phosphogluconolactonase
VIQAEIGATKAANLYHEALISVDYFDLTLLGIGVDGHTASLFPEQHQHNSTLANAIPVFDAPKPPLERVSLSLSRLNRSKNVFILAAGQDKKRIVQDYISGVFMPASLIKGEISTQFFYTQEK